MNPGCNGNNAPCVTRLSKLGLAALLLQVFITCPAHAEQPRQYEDVTPTDMTGPAGPPPPAEAAPAKAPPPARKETPEYSDDDELRRVEAVMGRSMKREYTVYSAMAVSGGTDDGFAEYLRNKYIAKRMGGIIMAAVVAPVIASLTVVGTVQLYRHGEDNGGFCNHVVYDEIGDEYDTDCEGDRGELSGMVLLSTIGGLATLGVFIPGMTRVARYTRRINRLTPLVVRADTQRHPVTFDYAVGAGGAGIRLLF